ncbi:MAG: hypothetical protein O2854_08510, partial [Chloroflexi bacterium]|nr:hypothetical protein [Chloroflexota bacterium]
MARDFDKILDECIDRIVLEGESVQHCLDLYPELRSELQPALERVVQSLSAFQTAQVSPDAKDLGRQRVHEAFRELEQAPPTQSSWLDVLFGSKLKVAGAALVLVLAVVFGGGSGIINASNNAVPGDTLYTVKRTAESL